MTQVARAFGPSFMAVWNAPYDETCFAFYGLLQRERIEAREDHAQRVRDAMRVNAAFAAPKHLEREHAELLRDLRKRPATPAMTKADAVAFAHDLLTKAGFRQDVS